MMQRQFANRSAREVRSSIRSKMLWLTLASVAVLAVYVPLATFLYRLFFPAYVDAALYSQLFSIVILSIIATPASSYLMAKRHVRELYIDGIGSYTFQIAVMVVGVYFWGLWGLIVARVITRLSDAVLITILFEITSRKDALVETSA
jgi:O-antigen/teichoic acid export membrane protein